MINAPGGVNGRKVNLTPYDLRKSVHSELEFSTYDPGCGTKEGSMKASKFTEAQIAFVLKQAQDGAPVAEVCRKAGISDATFYNWRKKYAGLMPSEMKRLRQLEDENAGMKRVVADLTLDRAMLQDVLAKKLRSLSASARLSTWCGRTGKSQSDAPVRPAD